MVKGQLNTKGETIHKTIQKQRVHKIQNQHTKQENKYKRIIWERDSKVGEYKNQSAILKRETLFPAELYPHTYKTG